MYILLYTYIYIYIYIHTHTYMYTTYIGVWGEGPKREIKFVLCARVGGGSNLANFSSSPIPPLLPSCVRRPSRPVPVEYNGEARSATTV